MGVHVSEAAVRQRAPNLVGVRELMLIEELATADRTHADLAEEFGVSTSAIDNFVARNKGRIAAAAQAQTDQLVGLWITRKQMRLAIYRAAIDTDMQIIADMPEAYDALSDSVRVPMGPDPAKVAQLQGVILRALEAVARETGQFGDQQQQGPSKLRHVVEGLEGWAE